MTQPALKDLQDMIDLLKERGGFTGESYTLHAPLVYARTLHTELAQRGIDVSFPCQGDEMLLELRNRGKVTVVIH